jgi:hypothetical protein
MYSLDTSGESLRIICGTPPPLWIEVGQPYSTLSHSITKQTAVHVTFVVRTAIKSKSPVFKLSKSVHILMLFPLIRNELSVFAHVGRVAQSV